MPSAPCFFDRRRPWITFSKVRLLWSSLTRLKGSLAPDPHSRKNLEENFPTHYPLQWCAFELRYAARHLLKATCSPQRLRRPLTVFDLQHRTRSKFGKEPFLNGAITALSVRPMSTRIDCSIATEIDKKSWKTGTVDDCVHHVV